MKGFLKRSLLNSDLKDRNGMGLEDFFGDSILKDRYNIQRGYEMEIYLGNLILNRIVKEKSCFLKEKKKLKR